MRISKGRLERDIQTLTTDLEARIREGIAARIRRYFDDKTLVKRLVLAKAAKNTLDSEQ